MDAEDLQRLIARGEARSHRTDVDAVVSIKRVGSPMTTGELIDDVRAIELT